MEGNGDTGNHYSKLGKTGLMPWRTFALQFTLAQLSAHRTDLALYSFVPFDFRRCFQCPEIALVALFNQARSFARSTISIAAKYLGAFAAGEPKGSEKPLAHQNRLSKEGFLSRSLIRSRRFSIRCQCVALSFRQFQFRPSRPPSAASE